MHSVAGKALAPELAHRPVVVDVRKLPVGRDGLCNRVEPLYPTVLGLVSARGRSAKHGHDAHLLELLDQVHESPRVDSLVSVLRVVAAEEHERPTRIGCPNLLTKVRRTATEHVPKVPIHPRRAALSIERVATPRIEIVDGLSQLRAVVEIDVGGGKAMEERFARHTRTAHLRKRVVAEIGVSRVNRRNIRLDGGAELYRLGLSLRR